MRRYLVVANQTLPSEQLQQELLLRAESEESWFYFLVPDTAKTDYSADWSDAGHNNSSGARQRMQRAISDMRAAGATALGSLEPADPLDAVEAQTRRTEYDEIIVSTLPKTLSRWLKLDLPSRIARAVKVQVTTIIAKDM